MAVKTTTGKELSIMLTLDWILKAEGIDPKQVLLIRHSKDKTEAVRKAGFLDLYTSIQCLPTFANASPNHPYWMTFMGEGQHARFMRMYVHDGTSRPADQEDMPDGYPTENMPKSGDRLYPLKPSELLANYRDRLIIEWKATQTLAEYTEQVCPPIISLADPNPEPFPGYDDLTIDRETLESIFDEPARYEKWVEALRNVQAVYLITCLEDGAQYVGSATGDENLLQRWRDYRKTEDGRNTGIARHLAKYPDHLKSFRYSILRVYGASASRATVAADEILFKKRLDSVKHGMNDNY